MRISMIDDELSIYKGKKVFIWGIGTEGKNIYKLLSDFSIPIFAFIDNDTSKQGTYFMGRNVYSPTQIDFEADDYVIQIGTLTYESEVEDILIERGVSNYVTLGDAYRRLPFLTLYKAVSKDEEFRQYYIDNVMYQFVGPRSWDNVLNPQYKNKKFAYMICMPPKTGDYTILHTLDGRPQQEAEYYVLNGIYSDISCWHSGYEFFEFKRFLEKNFPDKRIKLITGVREPIGQNLSATMQWISAGMYMVDQEFFWKGGGDFNKALDFLVKKNNNQLAQRDFYDGVFERKHYHVLIQNFFEEEYHKRMGIDILDLPFDKEKGCSSYKLEELDLFVYQIEKLNEIKKELFEFCELDENTELINSNIGEKKYYRKLYKNIQENIKFSREYFEWSFNSPYLHHFYTEKDIEMFKRKWEKHIE